MKAVDLSREIGCQPFRATGFWEASMQKTQKRRKARSRGGQGEGGGGENGVERVKTVHFPCLTEVSQCGLQSDWVAERRDRSSLPQTDFNLLQWFAPPK